MILKMKSRQKSSGVIIAIILVFLVVGAYKAFDLFSRKDNLPVASVTSPSLVVLKDSTKNTDVLTTQTNTQPKSNLGVVGENKPETNTNTTQPPGTGSTVLSSCREITTSGAFSLENNIGVPSEICLRIHDVKDVQVSCNGHVIKGDIAVQIKNAENISFTSCTFTSNIKGLVFLVEKSSMVEISESRFNKSYMQVVNSSNIKILRNFFDGYYQQTYTNQSVIDNNVFISPTNKELIQALITSSFGSGNSLLNNKIDGLAEGVLAKQIGADDGIYLEQESGALVRGNIIENIWDCGIETTDLIVNTIIDKNHTKNSGLCGIGGWYSSSWLGNTVSNNIIENTPQMFLFKRFDGLSRAGWDSFEKVPAEKIVYFKDNIFINNKFIDPHQTKDGVSITNSSSFTFQLPFPTGIRPGGKMPTENEVVFKNNKFSGNDFFSSINAPVFMPFSMVIDDGGNLCGEAIGPEGGFPLPDYPIKCSR